MQRIYNVGSIKFLGVYANGKQIYDIGGGVTVSGASLPAKTILKSIIRYDSVTQLATWYLNGVQVKQISAGAIAFINCSIGSSILGNPTSNPFQQFVNEQVYVPMALSDSQCLALTS